MPTTNNIKLSTPPHGANVNTWDADPINNNSGILDTCFGSVTATGLSNTPVTLSATALQVNLLRFSGALSGNVAVTVSAVIKTWTVENLCTGAFVVTLTGGSGNIIALPPGSSQVYWDGTNMSFVNLDKIGSYWDYAGAGVPAWVTACTVPPYLLCDGSTYSAVTYPLLNAILGTTTLPDSRARARIPLDGGTNRVTLGFSGIDGATRFSAGGSQGATVSIAQLPAHSHGVTDLGHVHPGIPLNINTQAALAGGGQPSVVQGTTNSGSAGTGISIQSTGADASHLNMQPTYVGGVTLIRAA